MLAILNSLNADNFSIFQAILVILISKFKVHRVLSDKTYLSLGLLSPLIKSGPSDKSEYWKTIFFISHQKHML